MRKRFLSMALALVMVLTLLPTPALAADQGGCGADGSSLTWRFSNGILTIVNNNNSPGRMKDYSNPDQDDPLSPDYVRPGWDGLTITTIVIEEGVTWIGDNAFVEFPDAQAYYLGSKPQVGEGNFAFAGDSFREGCRVTYQPGNGTGDRVVNIVPRGWPTALPKNGDTLTGGTITFTPKIAGQEVFGWMLGSDTSQDAYLPGYEYTFDKKDIVATAVWSNSTPKYDIEFDAASIAGSTPTQIASEYMYSEDKKQHLPLLKPQKAGYEFLGWTYQIENTPPNTMDPAQEIVLAPKVYGKVTITAHWTAARTITIYDKDDPATPLLVDTYQIKTEMQEKKISIPERPGYELVGIETPSPNSVTAKLSKSGGVITFVIPKDCDSAVTLNTVWKKNAYAIKYDLGGGAWQGGSAPATAKQTYTVSDTGMGKYFDLPSAADEIPQKVGYRFKGWACGNSAVEITDNEYYQIKENTTGDITFTALWEPIDYLLIYDAGDGAFPDGTTVNDDDQVERTFTIENEEKALAKIPEPTREGYAFRGWSLTAGGELPDEKTDLVSVDKEKGYEVTLKEGYVASVEPSIADPAKDPALTLHAIWKKQYILEFNQPVFDEGNDTVAPNSWTAIEDRNPTIYVEDDIYEFEDYQDYGIKIPAYLQLKNWIIWSREAPPPGGHASFPVESVDQEGNVINTGGKDQAVYPWDNGDDADGRYRFKLPKYDDTVPEKLQGDEDKKPYPLYISFTMEAKKIDLVFKSPTDKKKEIVYTVPYGSTVELPSLGGTILDGAGNPFLDKDGKPITIDFTHDADQTITAWTDESGQTWEVGEEFQVLVTGDRYTFTAEWGTRRVSILYVPKDTPEADKEAQGVRVYYDYGWVTLPKTLAELKALVKPEDWENSGFAGQEDTFTLTGWGSGNNDHIDDGDVWLPGTRMHLLGTYTLMAYDGELSTVELTMEPTYSTEEEDRIVREIPKAWSNYPECPEEFVPWGEEHEMEFVGWGVGSGVIEAGDFHQFLTNTTLPAVWEGKIEYHNIGGAKPEADTYRYSLAKQNLTVKAPERENLYFDKWICQNEDVRVVGETVMLPEDFTGTLVLEAVWKPGANAKQVTLTFQDGSGNKKDLTEYNGNAIYAGDIIDLTKFTPEDFGFTAPTGKTFDGWSNADGVKTVIYTAQEGGATFTAIWKGDGSDEEPGYLITFDFANGSRTQAVRTDSKGIVKPWPAEPTYAGHTFEGWSDGTAKVDANTVFTKDTTVTAQWKKNAQGPEDPDNPDKPDPPGPDDPDVTGKYTITFSGGSGVTGVTNLPSAMTTVNGRLTALPTTIPKRTGYSFQGWYSASSGGDPITVTYVFTKDTTIYAHWESEKEDESTFPITVNSAANGTVTASATRAAPGTTVTVTVSPNSGYELDSLRVTSGDGGRLNLSGQGSGRYRFTMPRARVTVTASFTRVRGGSSSGGDTATGTPGANIEPWPVTLPGVPQAGNASQIFRDIPVNYWAAGEIAWAYGSGYMNGTGNGNFNPGGVISHQQLWLVLSRISGGGAANMAGAIEWANLNGLAAGTNPATAVTRQQLVGTLYQCTQLMGRNVTGSANLAAYNDSRLVTSANRNAMEWAVANGIIGGNKQNRLNPNGTVTRDQFAVILYRFCRHIA